MAEKIHLRRHGGRPIAFEGQRIAEATSQADSGPGETRWWQLGLYRTTSGAFVLSLGYRTRWQGEVDVDLAHRVESATELEAILANQDPLEFATGLKMLQQRSQDSREDPRARTLSIQYRAAVSHLLDSLPESLS
jgi:hypothetical protein